MLIPENELGVIVRFASEAKERGFDIVSISAAFPDAIITKEGKTYRAEFEFESSSFDVHGHDARDCDLIICWANNTPEHVLPVIALAEREWYHTDLKKPGQAEREAHYWRYRALKAENALRLEKSKQPETPTDNRGTFATKQEFVCWLHEKCPSWNKTKLAQEANCSASTVTRALASNNGRKEPEHEKVIL